LHHKINDGWTISEDLDAAILFELQKLGWRYTALHFERGTDVPFPEPVLRPGFELEEPEQEPGPATWADVDDITELIPEHVRELLRGA
jgi:hypothetical protein